MENEYVKGHRSRLKDKYKSGGFSHDYELLELLLTYSIPRRDVKPAAKGLLAKFGSIEGVLNATPCELESVAGIGESSAILIALLAEINSRAFEPESGQTAQFFFTDEIAAYCRSALAKYGDGALIMITLNNSGGIITCNEVSADFRNYTESGSIKPFGSIFLRDSAARVVFAQKTDNPCPRPSVSTISFVIKMIAFFRELNSELTDYIIIGSEGATYSMRTSERYKSYFE